MTTNRAFSVGMRLPLKESLQKVKGSAEYVFDVELNNMLWASVLRSPHAHAIIKSINIEEALKVPGVKTILTKDNQEKKLIPSFYGYTDKFLFDQAVRFAGEEVAAVAADSLKAAEEAISKINVEYEILPHVLEIDEAIAPGAPRVHPDKENNIALYIPVEWGNVKEGFAEADYMFEKTFETPAQAHCCIEPHCCVADYRRANNSLTVWSSTQSPYHLRETLGRFFELPLTQVQVIKPVIGGGFGSKLEMRLEPIAALLSKASGHPVKLVNSRREEFIATCTRLASKVRIKVGTKKDGTITAIEIDAKMNTGAYIYQGGAVLGVLVGTCAGTYRVPNAKVDGYCIYTNRPVGSGFRGFGNTQAQFVIESMIDQVCEELGIDQIDFRLKNYKQVGDIGFTGMPINTYGLPECLEKGAKIIGWKDRKNKGEALPFAKKVKGIGMSCFTHTSGSTPFSRDTSSAIVNLHEDGTVSILLGTADLGTGSDTTISQIVAEELQVDLNQIRVISGNTLFGTFDEGAYASRTLYVAGNAALRAAKDAKEQLIENLAKVHNVSIEKITYKNGIIEIEGLDQKMGVVEAIQKLLTAGNSPGPIVGRSSFRNQFNPLTFGAQFAEVEVDIGTGLVEVKRIVSCHDVGRAINPMICEGQIEGGVLMGAGYALAEEPIFDMDTGTMLNASLSNYYVPTAADSMDIIPVLVETNDPSGPFGAKGLGEPPILGVAPAIANAVYNATGIRFTKLPIKPADIVKAIVNEGDTSS